MLQSRYCGATSPASAHPFVCCYPLSPSAGQGHINPTILEGLSETEARLAALKAEAEADAGNVVEIPRDIGALYRAHVDALAETLSGGDVIGRASG